MAGKIHQQIQRLIAECGHGNPAKVSFIRTKLILKGINPDNYGPNSDDTPEILDKIQTVSQTLLGA